MCTSIPLSESLPVDPLEQCTIVPLNPCAPHTAAYSDRSFDGTKCAAAVTLPTGEAWRIRPPGHPSAYRTELYGLALACQLVGDGTCIRTDSMAALAAVQGGSTRVTLGTVVELIRSQATAKRLTLQYVPGHVGEEGNERVDAYSKAANASLPDPPPPVPRNPWDIVWGGEIVTSPHKTWVRHTRPQHTPEGIHPVSWRPIRRKGWFRWLLGLQWSLGHQAPQSYWHRCPSTFPCAYCGRLHNASIHGHIGLCPSPANPAVQLWAEAW